MSEKQKMQVLLKDVGYRLQKIKDNPPGDQIEALLQQIEKDRLIMHELARSIGGVIFRDYQIFAKDLEHYISTPEDIAAYPQVQDDINILVNELDF